MDGERQSDKRDPAQLPARRGILRFLPLVVIFAAMVAVYASGATGYLTLEKLLQSRDRLGAFIDAHKILALLTYGAIYAACVALSLPGALLLTISGGFLFGWLAGGIAATISASLGATVIFLVARTSLGAALRERAGPSLAGFRDGFERDAASYLLFLRLAPVFPFWLVNLAPALLNVPLKTFVWTTCLGIIPGTFAYAFAGSGLDSVALAQRRAFDACVASGATDCKADISLHQLVTPHLMLAFAGLGIIALVPALLRRWRAIEARRGGDK